MRAALLAVVLATAGLAGCVGSDGGVVASQVTTGEETASLAGPPAWGTGGWWPIGPVVQEALADLFGADEPSGEAAGA